MQDIHKKEIENLKHQLTETQEAFEKMQKRQDERDQLFREEMQRQMNIVVESLSDKNKKKHLEFNLVKPNTPPSDVFNLYTRNSSMQKIKGKNGKPDKIIVGFKPEDMALLDPKNEPVKELVDGMIKRKGIIKNQLDKK